MGWRDGVGPRYALARQRNCALEKFLRQRDDDAGRASHVTESVLVLVLDYLADELAALGEQASDSVVDALDCEHDAPKAERVRRCDSWFERDEFWIVKLCQLEPSVPIGGLHHDDVDSDAFDSIDAVHPVALDRRLVVDSHAKRGEKIDSGCEVVDYDDDVVQSLDCHFFSITEAWAGLSGALLASGFVRY